MLVGWTCCLQGKIFLFEFGKILGFGLGWHTLQRIIAESSAMMGGGDNAALLADDLILVDFPGKNAICTVSVNFLPKQHGDAPPLGIIIHVSSAVFQRNFLEVRQLAAEAAAEKSDWDARKRRKKSRQCVLAQWAAEDRLQTR